VIHGLEKQANRRCPTSNKIEGDKEDIEGDISISTVVDGDI
jgi:hypothetical protein